MLAIEALVKRGFRFPVSEKEFKACIDCERGKMCSEQQTFSVRVAAKDIESDLMPEIGLLHTATEIAMIQRQLERLYFVLNLSTYDSYVVALLCKVG